MKNILIILLLILGLSVKGQEKTADKYYKKGDYINAIVYYEQHLKRYKPSKKVVQNLAESYYRIFKYRKARKYMLKLIEGKFTDSIKTIDNSSNFKMHHILSALGNYDEGVNFLETYYKNENIPFNKNNAINEIESFKLKTIDYTQNQSLVNSKYSEFGAVRVKDSLYFVSNRKNSKFEKLFRWTHQPFLNIYKANIKDDKALKTTITALPKEINSKLHEGNFCFSKDGNILYFSRSNISKNKKEFDDNKVNSIQIFKSIKKNGKWLTPEILPFCKNNFSYQHPALNEDETKLYLSSNEGKSTEDFDIFYVDIEENHQQFGSLINLGKTVNTKHREHFPFISKEGNLFFSSNGHLGLGMLDIFVSEKEKNGTFKKPLNLGAPINSKYDDFSLVYTDGNSGYFASNRRFKNDDIYKFKQISDILTEEYIVDIEIRDLKTKKLIKASTIVTDSNKEIVYKNIAEKFKINIIPQTYSLSANAPLYKNKVIKFVGTKSYNQKQILYLEKEIIKEVITKVKETIPKSTNVAINSKTNPHKNNQDLKLIKQTDADTEPKNNITLNSEKINNQPKLVNDIKSLKIKETKNNKILDPDKISNKTKLINDIKGPKIIEKDGEIYFDMPNINFEFNKWTLTEESKKILDELAEKLERHPTIYIKINAHTDNRGTEKYNQFLSEKRAESTRNYLALVGFINARRMEFEGFGESIPIQDCKKQCTEEEHYKNRRSEFKIIKY